MRSTAKLLIAWLLIMCLLMLSDHDEADLAKVTYVPQPDTTLFIDTIYMQNNDMNWVNEEVQFSNNLEDQIIELIELHKD